MPQEMKRVRIFPLAIAPRRTNRFFTLAIGTIAFTLCLSAIAGCNGKKREGKKSNVESLEPLVKTAFVDGRATGKFTRLTAAQSGIDFQQSILKDHELRRLYYSGFACGGLAIGDVTGDGLADLFVVDNAGANRLYRNDGDMKFTDITKEAGIVDQQRWGGAASMADIDNDGDLDIYVCTYNAGNELLINDGQGKFTDEAEKYKANFRDSSMMGYFNDLDGDGCWTFTC